MLKILKDHNVSKETVAIIPAFEIEFQSIIIKENTTLYVKKTPLELIQQACLHHGANYDGRRHSVIHHTGYYRCVPIPVSPREDMFAFPTHSPNNYKCSWIFFNSIKHIKASTTTPKETIIYFDNGKSITVDVPFHTIVNQRLRTFVCRNKILGKSFYYKGG